MPPPEIELMIELRDITKIFNCNGEALRAVDGVSLSIAEGEIFGIVGYSGAGKSTLVRCINLLERPDSGSISVGGFGSINFGASAAEFSPCAGAPVRLNEKHLRQLRQDIGMIFQHFNLFDRSTVFDNIAYPLRHCGLTREQIHARVLELLEMVDLCDKADTYPAELSGGQKQRVAIARALARRPKILLSDEATSALDPEATESILRLLKELNSRLNITIVLITHEMAVVKAICDRVAVMEKGKVVECGEVYRVFSSPAMDITRSFVGSSSGLDKIGALIETKSSVVSGGGLLVKCVYDKGCVGEAIISEVSRMFGVNVNIILGSVEILQDMPLGGLVVLISGSSGSVEAAVEYMRSRNVKVEVIRND